jgi:hypothetical protein
MRKPYTAGAPTILFWAQIHVLKLARSARNHMMLNLVFAHKTNQERDAKKTGKIIGAGSTPATTRQNKPRGTWPKLQPQSRMDTANLRRQRCSKPLGLAT